MENNKEQQFNVHRQRLMVNSTDEQNLTAVGMLEGSNLHNFCHENFKIHQDIIADTTFCK
jgi:hypothetical protein